jgi:hypothetical protein
MSDFQRFSKKYEQNEYDREKDEIIDEEEDYFDVRKIESSPKERKVNYRYSFDKENPYR